MSTSTIPAVKRRLVDRIASAPAGLQVFYAWPGPATPPRCVFLGRHPALDDVRIDGRQEIATIQAGRKQRQEEYDIPVTVWSFAPDLSAGDAEQAEVRAFDDAAVIEDLLADDPTVGLGPQVHSVRVGDLASTLFPFQKGWACELILRLEVKARLT